MKDDNKSYEYIGYILTKSDKKYIVRDWVGYHEDGSVIGMKVFYTLDGKYIGNIRYGRTAGTSTSSLNSTSFVSGEPLNKK